MFVKVLVSVAVAVSVTATGAAAVKAHTSTTTDVTVNGNGNGYSKDQCKDGGWKNMGMGFKNQGDCVSFFATGGRNQPAGQ